MYSDEQQQSAFHEANLFLTAKRDKKIDGGGLAPLEWWSVNRPEYPALFEIARRVFTMPTSSAAAERSWSIYKYIHSKLRNQLLSETVQKLVFIYSNRLSDDKTPEVTFNPSTLDRCDEDEDSARPFIDNSFEYQGSQD
ncbi:hypothetical protein DVH05_010549 [Phytophthora capsici]|nr:hypothetical protein DVH05_010549 [Phytophthora capsici]